MNTRLFTLILLSQVGLAGCANRQKPVERVERGWVTACLDKTVDDSDSHGLPLMLFSTRVFGHFDQFTFSSHEVPPCDSWDIHMFEVDLPHTGGIPEYEITVRQHTNLLGQIDGTWDFIKMRHL